MRKIRWQIDRCRGIPYRAAPCLLWQSNRNLCTSNEKDSTSSKRSNAKDSTGDYASSSSETLDEIRVEDRIPRDIVTILDEYIVGQNKAKRAMAVALRNRWRRNRVEDTELRSAILPKNILLVGPTGVGKTEISRRMARITDAPFVKVEATKYTEVGFAGKDVDTMIEDLYSASKIVARKQLGKARTQEVKEAVEAILVEKLAEKRGCSETEARTLLQSGEAEEVEITYEITTSTDPASEGGLDPFGLGKKFPGNRELSAAFRSLFQGLRSGFGGDATEADPTSMVRSVKSLVRPIRLAREDLFKEELSKRIPNAAITQRAAVLCQEHGIVFIDEIDKVVVGAGARRGGGNTNEEGVQHDLLPILEGTSVTTKDGTVLRTDNILFIASGAFHAVKPSGMVAELQGRLPIRVELEALGMEDLCKILTTPRFNILKQMVHLLKTENITLRFANDAVREMAQVSKRWNDSMQNIGARRLHTILEQVTEKYCFDVEQYQGQEIELTKADVKEALQRFEQTMDLAKYLL